MAWSNPTIKVKWCTIPKDCHPNSSYPVGYSSGVSYRAKKQLIRMMPGGLSRARSATPEIQEIADKVKSLLEEKTNEKYEVFKAVEYKSQVVAGQNYFIKVCCCCCCCHRYPNTTEVDFRYIHRVFASGLSCCCRPVNCTADVLTMQMEFAPKNHF